MTGLELAGKRVKPGGRLFVAIYNDQGADHLSGGVKDSTGRRPVQMDADFAGLIRL